MINSYTRDQIVLMGFSATLLSLATIIGNLLVLISFKMDKRLQTISNYFLCSLAIADIIIGLISMPLFTVFVIQREWTFGVLICDVWLSVDYLASNASVLNLLVISFDRYFSVTRPLTYRVRRTPQRAGLMIFFAWAVSAFVWPPWIFAWPYIEGIRTVPDNECYIQFIYSNEFMSIVTVMIAFYIPVSVMIGLYLRIWAITVSRQKNLFLLQGGRFPSIKRLSQPRRFNKLLMNRGSICPWGRLKRNQLLPTGSNNIHAEDGTSDNSEMVPSPKVSQSEAQQIPSALPLRRSAALENSKLENQLPHLSSCGTLNEQVAATPTTVAFTVPGIEAQVESGGICDGEIITIVIRIPPPLCHDVISDSCVETFPPRPSIRMVSGEPSACHIPLHPLVPRRNTSLTNYRVGEEDPCDDQPTSRQQKRNDPLDWNRWLGQGASTLATKGSELNRCRPQPPVPFLQGSEAGRLTPLGIRAPRSESKRHDKKAAKTLSAILLAFIVTWTPYSALVIANALLGKELASHFIPDMIWQFSYYLCYINSTVNPILYALCNPNFRHTYTRILSGQWCLRRGATTNNPS